MKTHTVDPTSFGNDHPLSVALRRVSRYWHLAYSKLLSLEWVWDTSFPFGATDGNYLLLNPDGIAKLASRKGGTDYIAFLLVHEALHALLGHGWRLSKMSDRMAANEAADYIINALIAIRNRELGKEVFRLIPGVLIDEVLSGDKSVEQLYRELIKPGDPSPSLPPPDEPPPETGDEPDGSEGSGEGESGSDCTQQDKGDSDEPTTPEEQDTSGSGGGGDADDGGTPEGFPGTGAPDTRAPESTDGEDYKEIVDRIEEDNDRLFTMDAIHTQIASDMGTTPKHRIASHRDAGYQMPWYDILREWLMDTSFCGWNSPFNHSIHSATGLVAAGRSGRAAGTMVWVIDTSGSVGATTFARFLGEAQCALDALKPEEMHLLSVSHVVCEALIFEPGDSIPSQMKGGGGTRFQPAFDWVDENNVQPDVMVYLTDGLARDVNELEAPDYPVVWLSTYAHRKHYPFGEVIQVREGLR
tara:strand:+ start:1245 stop:2654 length:1410 start_codon:yes stop_codon:yes gene_type:complete